MYAVVTTGGKQYRVEPGTTLTVERLSADAGAPVTFDRVLLVGDGEAVTVGTPTIEGASVSGTILGEALGPKIIIFKFKQKAKYRRSAGHRQHLMRVRIDEISAGGKRATVGESAVTEPAQVSTAKADAPASATSEAETKQSRPKAASAATADAPTKPAARRRSPAKKAGSKKAEPQE